MRWKHWILALMLIPSLASASIEGLYYLDAGGEKQSLDSSDEFLNVNTKLGGFVRGGLDRKVGLTTLDSSGTKVDTVVSDLIGVEDTKVIDGKSRYGFDLEIPMPEGEGTFTLQSVIYDSQGEIVETTDRQFLVDRSPVSFGVPKHTQYRRYRAEQWNVVSTYGGGPQMSTDFAWEGAPPVKAVVTATARADGSVGTKEIPVADSGISAMLGHAIFKHRESWYDMELKVWDEAGNTQTVEWEAMFDARGRPFEVVGVYDPTVPESQKPWKHIPGLEDYTPYVEGMKLGVGRTRLLTKLKKDDHYSYNEFGNYGPGSCCTDGYFDWNRSIVHEEGDYVFTQTGWKGIINYEPQSYKAQAGSIGADGAIFRTYVTLGVKDDARATLREGVTLTAIYADGSTSSARGVGRPAGTEQIMTGVTGRLAEPVPYDVEIRFAQGNNTIVPAGETEWEVDGAWTTTTYARFNACWAEGDPLCSSAFHTSIHRNTDPPRVEDWTYRGVTGPGTHEYEVKAWARYATANSYYRLRYGHIALVDQSGEEVYRASRVSQTNSASDYVLDFKVQDVPTGLYDVKIILEDRIGNVTEEVIETRFFDLDKPGVKFTANGEPWTGGDIGKLSDIGVEVINNGSQASIQSIIMSGGAANDNYELAWRSDGDKFRLEYPLMFPSRAPGEEYTIAVTVEDEQKNSATYTEDFAFKPRTTVVNGEQGILIPAIPESITGGGLPPIYSEPVRLDESTLVVGEYDLVVTLRSDADFGVNILGYSIQPGDTVIIDKYDFNAHGSKIALPVYPTEAVVGQANLLISPAAPGSDYVLADIQTWKPNPVVTVNGEPFGDGLTIQQALEPVEISVVGGEGDPCTYTSVEEDILASNPLIEPMCTIDWDLPDTITWDKAEYLANGYLTGVEEDAEIGYKVFIPQGGDIHGAEVESDQTAIDVVHPDVAFAFDPDEAVTRYITEFSKSVKNTGTAECTPTVNPSDARVGTKYGYPKCLIEWNLVPPGIATSRYTPIVQGVAQTPEQMEFTFDVTYYDPDQNPYFLPLQSLTVPVDPPKPVEITLPESEYEPEESGAPRYFVGIDGDYLGTANLTASGADIDLDISKDGESVQSLPYLHRGGRDRDTNYEFRIWMDDLALWEESAVEVSGAYQLMPEINDAKQATVIGVPSTQMRAKLEVDGRKLLDTDEISVDVNLDGRAVYDGYSPHVHGLWQVQIRYEEQDGEIENLTDWQYLESDGSLTADLTLGERNDGYMYAVVRLDSPYEEYSRDMISNRNYINVLRGGEIDGEITASRVTGRSVFTAFLRVQVEDQSYDSSLGEVEWLISEDEGSTWSPVEDGARGNYMKGDFEAGRYWIKARLHNKYTDAVSETGIQQIHVYDVPRVDIEGAQYAFKTQEVELNATATLDWEPVPIENYHVEWSSDGGETWEPGLTTTASYDGETDRVRYRVRVRDMDAPMDEEGIWRERSHRLNFIDPVGPRTRIYGPRRLERGDPGDYEVEMNPPRRNMDVEMAGEWQLPDGTIIPGNEPITYNPSEDDVENGRVELIYRSWVVGYRDQGAIDERVHRISAWQYVWPEWDVFANTRAMEAPAEIRLTPRTPGWFGWLDEEQYDWTFPQGSSVVYDNETRPTIRIDEPGDHEIKLLVSDARGNETEVVKKVTLEEPSATEIDFSYYTDNEFMRAPLEVRPRIYMRGGHRLDRVKEREILINGETLVRDTQIREFVIKEPGTYSVTAKLYSTMGREVQTTRTFEVVPNKPPVCEPATDDRFGYLIIEANCSDSDGDIDEIRWEMAGEELPSSSYKYRFTEDQLEEMGGSVQIQASAQDDAGAFSERVPVTYTAP